MKIYFTDHFNVPEETLEQYGAFNISLVTDLPLFIDPFLLFNSDKPEYQALHDDIIRYLRFLKSQSDKGSIPAGLIKAWYCFSEVRQNWLRFCETGNSGRGLGVKFAHALDENLVHVFKNFGNERVTQGCHLEKLCLMSSGIGRDMISDFTTNLMKDFLLQYTQRFAQEHIAKELRTSKAVNRALFSSKTNRWMPKVYDLPVFENDFVLLTPKDILGPLKNSPGVRAGAAGQKFAVRT